jgi:stage II sporulation protein D
MRPGTTSAAIDEAVRDTAGETLWFRGKQATVFFSEHCGGMTEDASAVWPQVHGVPYLHSHVDPYCLRRGPAAWHAEIPLKDFVPIAAAQGWHLPQPVLAVRVLDRSSSHRPLRVEFTGASSATAVVDARALRFAIDRALGWNRIRSGQFNLAVRYGVIVFDGRGYGHGVGLCQTGATEMAAGHKTAQQIIAFYFPGTSIGIGRDDSGWLTVQRGPITVRSTEALPPAKLDDIEQIWGRALQRFPPRRTVAPEIVFAPSVEIFRQLTAQPGWVAASTSGSRIVLEPMRTLQASSDTTVLHEMLHVLVESEASERAPLWLREGLVAELAGEPRAPTITMPAIAIEAALRNAASQSEDEHAHRQAAARVHALIARYGLSSVRGWLVSSVPPGVA